MNLKSALEKLNTLEVKPEFKSDAFLLLQMAGSSGITDFACFVTQKGSFYITCANGSILLDIKIGETFTVIEDWDGDFHQPEPKTNLNLNDTIKELREWLKKATSL